MQQMIFCISRYNASRMFASLGLIVACMLVMPFAQVKAQPAGSVSVKAAEQAATDAANRLDFVAMEQFAQIACDGGSDNGCRLLLARYDGGLHYLPNNPQPWSMGKSQPIKAAAVLQTLCDRNKASDCRELAGRLRSGSSALPKDNVRAAKLYQKACDLGSGASCADGGNMYANGDKVPNDPVVATIMLEKACELMRRADQCGFLAGRYAEGRGVKKDDMAAARLYRRACDDFGEFFLSDACYELGAAHAAGRGTVKDSSLALNYYNKACDGKVGAACDALGNVYVSNSPISAGRDDKRAFEYFRRACDMAFSKACYTVGIFTAAGMGTPRNIEQAVYAYEKGCKGKDGVVQSCINLAQIATSGQIAKLDLRIARSALLTADRLQPTAEQKIAMKTQSAALNDRLCDNGDAASCFIRGADYASGNAVAKDEGRAATLFGKACTGGLIDACVKEGILLIRKGTLPTDHARAAELFRRGCDNRNASGCFYLGALYADGKGVEANRPTAIALMKQAQSMYPDPDLEKRIAKALALLQN